MYTCLPNHPIAIINNGLVDSVIPANTHDKDSINNILSRVPHEHVFSSCEQGYEIYIGCEKFKDKVRKPSPYKSWVYEYDINMWVPPIDYPKDATTLWEYFWDEDSGSWLHCNCFKVE